MSSFWMMDLQKNNYSSKSYEINSKNLDGIITTNNSVNAGKEDISLYRRFMASARFIFLWFTYIKYFDMCD